MIIAIDFDGTIVDHAFPKIGKPMPLAFEVMKGLKEKGHKLILWTCREDEGKSITRQYLREAVDFCKENGVEFDAINESADDWREGDLRRKVYCDIFIDDRNLGGFPGWAAVKKELLDV